MFGRCFIFGNSNNAQSQIQALKAWWLSSKLYLTAKQHRRCFGTMNNRKKPNFKLAHKLSRMNFKKKYPDYVEACKRGSISEEKKKEMFNVFEE